MRSYIAVGIVTGLLVYTFSAHSRAVKRTVLYAVGGLALGLVVVGVVATILNSAPSGPTEPEQRQTPDPVRIVSRRPLEQILVDRLDVFDVAFELGPFTGMSTQSIVGRVTNRSDLRLAHLGLHLRLLSDGTVIDENDLSVDLAVPPGETRRFSGRVPLRPASRDSRYGQGTFARRAHDLEFDVVRASGYALSAFERERQGQTISTEPDSSTSLSREAPPQSPDLQPGVARAVDAKQPYTANDAFFFRSDESPPAEPAANPVTPSPLTKIRDVPPVYPQQAIEQRVEGVVVLELAVAPDGKVTDVRVIESVPGLDGAATDAARQWEYAPPRQPGVTVTARVPFQLLPFTFPRRDPQ